MTKYTLQWGRLKPIGVKTDTDGTVIQVFNEYDVQRKYGRELIKWTLDANNQESLSQDPWETDDWGDPPQED